MIEIILILITLTLSVWVVRLDRAKQSIIQINENRQKINSKIEEDIANNNNELRELQQKIMDQRSVLQVLNESRESAQKSAEAQAQATYETRVAQLNEQYEQLKKNLNNDYSIEQDKLEAARRALKDLEDKQKAYIQAQKRQEAIAANEDYYKLSIDTIDMNDIELLRELQKRIGKKESIDKVIYETYYRPAYDTLMSHIFNTKDKVCGIYKLTDVVTGLAYVGQSVDCKERMRQHIKSGLAYNGATNKLYQAMRKSGPENFIFELLEEVPREKLNEREKYWIQFYDTRNQLNGTLGGA